MNCWFGKSKGWSCPLYTGPPRSNERNLRKTRKVLQRKGCHFYCSKFDLLIFLKLYWKSYNSILKYSNSYFLTPFVSAILYWWGALTLFRPGGGREFCPRWLWTLITFLILKQTLSNLASFSKTCLGTIWYNRWLSTWLDVSMATSFWQACFSKSQSLLV